MAPPKPQGGPGGLASRVSLGRRLQRGLGLPAELDVQASDLGGRAPSVAAADAKGATWFLPVRLVDGEGAGRDALLRGVRLEGSAEASPESLERWRAEHALIAQPLHRAPGLLRPLEGVAAAGPAVLPPLFYCTEKRVFVPSPDDSGAEPLDALWRAARKGGASKTVSAEIPCLACGERDKCYPASGASRDPGTAGARLSALSDRPWGALLIEPFHLPLPAWLRLASGESWRAVRSSLASWPPSLTGRLDRMFAGARPTILGPEHGASFGLETFLLRLEWLRQTLEALRSLAEGPRRPHLGIGLETLAFALDEPGVWGAPLWTSRVAFLTSGAARATGDGSFEPLPGRSTAMVPPACRGGAAWVRGRCLPRGTAKTLTSAKKWEFHFLPSESAAQAPAKGAAVRFALDADGEPSGVQLDGRVDMAFRDVWMVTVDDPATSEATIREMLLREDGRPSIVMQAVSDHGLADDLYAVGSLWLSSLVAEPGSVPAAVRLREALRTAPADASRPDAAEASGPCFYVTRAGAPGQSLPVELIDGALDLGNRMCGGSAGAFPGQGHEPVDPAKRPAVYDGFLDEVAALASDARHRLFGYAPADAEIRSLLEGALRAS